jgi:RNA polymerase sigma-70 factor (ECF subfamily)
MSKVLQHLRRAALLRDGAGLTDGELLEAYVTGQDGAYFEALVRRHGPMVFGVCRRVLRDPHDAEDAFQATFLVLVRKAGSVVPREMVGNWLYGVAYRTALEAKRATARRRARERQVDDMPHPTVEPEECWRDLQPLLDRELNRLPDKYRVPVVLCDLEGRTRKEAARQLDLPEGTVSGRLTTARRILAKRLARHGLTLSAGALAAALSHGSASAAVPTTLVAATVQAAGQATTAGAVSAQVAALANTVVKVMALAKLKTAAALVLAAVVLGGAGVAAYHNSGGAETRPEAGPDIGSLPPPVVVIEKSDREKLQGTWVAVSIERAGVKNNDPNIDDYQFTFAGDGVTYRSKNRKTEGSFRLDPTRKPKEIDMELNEEVVTQAIYELDGNRLKLCWAKPPKPSGRPTEFDTANNPFTILYVFEKKP